VSQSKIAVAHLSSDLSGLTIGLHNEYLSTVRQRCHLIVCSAKAGCRSGCGLLVTRSPLKHPLVCQLAGTSAKEEPWLAQVPDGL
jgi:hypothetical protein